MSALTAAALLLLLAEAPASTSTSTDEYRVGPGDLLEVVVAGRPDLSRLATVQTTGTIRLPRAGELGVRGLSVGEIAERLAPLLAAEALEPPRITVRVREYHSQFVWTRGALARPGRKPLAGGTRLVDVLLASGGFLSEASGEVVIDRANGVFEGGGHRLALRFGRPTPGPGDLERMALPLAPGDIVTASAQQWVVVSGAARRPGRHPYQPALTLTRAVQGAGGLLPAASRRVRVLRGDAPAARREIEADLDAIRRGRQEDLLLQPGDEIVIEARRL